MRISEITDAQGQLELLRTVIDNTWTAIAQQAEQEKRAEAERKAQTKLKPRAKKSGKGKSIRIPSLSGILCLRHSMSKRSIYANESKDRCGGHSGIAAHFV